MAEEISPGTQATTSPAARTAALSLHDQNLKIPNLWPLFERWPRHRHAGYEDAKTMIDSSMIGQVDPSINGPDPILTQSSSSTPEKRATIQAANPALLASYFWPYATEADMRHLAIFVLWQGWLDDFLETLRNQPEDFGQVQRTGLETMFEVGLPGHTQLELSPGHAALASAFKDIMQPFCEWYGVEHRQALKTSLLEYVTSTAIEEGWVRSGMLPSYHDYMSLRKMTGGAGPLAELAEFAARARLPSWVIDSVPYKTALDSVRTIISLTNDLMSLKKELQNGQSFNAIPVLLNSRAHYGLGAAVTFLVNEMQYAVVMLELSERQLLERGRLVGEPEVMEIAKVFNVLKTNCTGNLSWSLESKRYELEEPARDGSVTVKLAFQAAGQGTQ